MMTSQHLPSKTTRLSTNCGPMYLTFVYDEEFLNIVHVLVLAGKAGGCASAHLSSYSNLFSQALTSQDYDDRIVNYSSIVGSRCHLGLDGCIDKVTRLLMEEEMRLKERRDKYERQ